MLTNVEATQQTREPVMKIMPAPADRRKDRRRNFEGRQLIVEQVDAKSHKASKIGMLLDLSTSGLRFRAGRTQLTVGAIVQIRLTLPSFAGISPFLMRASVPVPTSQWTGWITVTRVAERLDGTHDIAGELMGLDEADIGMLGVYLSTQPIAA
ncbi:MAG: PilZ domain-containing protein [Tepidisphaeraceae bacterium]